MTTSEKITPLGSYYRGNTVFDYVILEGSLHIAFTIFFSNAIDDFAVTDTVLDYIPQGTNHVRISKIGVFVYVNMYTFGRFILGLRCPVRNVQKIMSPEKMFYRA